MGQGLLVPLGFAGLVAAMILFRGSISLYTRLAMVGVIAGITVFWWPEVFAEANALAGGQWLNVLKSSLLTAANALPWIWAMALIIVFYAGHDKDSQVFLMILIFFSIIVAGAYALITLTSTFSSSLPVMHSTRF